MKIEYNLKKQIFFLNINIKNMYYVYTNQEKWQKRKTINEKNKWYFLINKKSLLLL